MLWLLLLLAVRWHSTTTYNSNARQQPLVGRLLLLQPVWRSKFSVALCHYYRTTVEVRYTKPSPRGWRLSDTSGVLSLPSSDTSPTTLSNNAGRQRFLLLGDFFFFAAKNSSMPKQEFLSRMCKIILVMMIYQKMVIDLLEIAQNSKVEFTPLKNLKKVTHLNIIHFVSNFFGPRVVVKNNGKSRENHF